MGRVGAAGQRQGLRRSHFTHQSSPRRGGFRTPWARGPSTPPRSARRVRCWCEEVECPAEGPCSGQWGRGAPRTRSREASTTPQAPARKHLSAVRRPVAAGRGQGPGPGAGYPGGGARDQWGLGSRAGVPRGRGRVWWGVRHRGGTFRGRGDLKLASPGAGRSGLRHQGRGRRGRAGSRPGLNRRRRRRGWRRYQRGARER